MHELTRAGMNGLLHLLNKFDILGERKLVLVGIQLGRAKGFMPLFKNFPVAYASTL